MPLTASINWFNKFHGNYKRTGTTAKSATRNRHRLLAPPTTPTHPLFHLVGWIQEDVKLPVSVRFAQDMLQAVPGPLQIMTMLYQLLEALVFRWKCLFHSRVKISNIELLIFADALILAITFISKDVLKQDT
ncbi:hypothetical protein CDAR_31081 [Caerostris darwini]|uniref:Uncharacterized protein n=1 Tax=Caerostris darwini TaxID=1538125 RepID=A0AAV4RU66_9ARAC|nr:hypothetical protein CDAR_31081 [Caerostris darwini]